MNTEQLYSILNHKNGDMPPRAILYASYLFVNRGTRNERDGSGGWFSLIDVSLFYSKPKNRERYYSFLEKHNLKKTPYDETL